MKKMTNKVMKDGKKEGYVMQEKIKKGQKK
jgi:hypothetical protein